MDFLPDLIEAFNDTQLSRALPTAKIKSAFSSNIAAAKPLQVGGIPSQ
jgi:hypothetical protein